VSRPGQAGHDDHSYGITEYLRLNYFTAFYPSAVTPIATAL